MDGLSSLIDAYNHKLISDKVLSEALESDFMRLERNQMVKQAKVFNRLIDNELTISNMPYAKSPEEIVVDSERYRDIVDFLLFLRIILGDIRFEIFISFVLFHVPQKELAIKYHYSRGGIASLVYFSKLKIQSALEQFPSKKVVFDNFYDALVYYVPPPESGNSSKVGFVFESLKQTTCESYWKENKKTHRKKYVVKKKCMIPEYIGEGTICTLCLHCSRKKG